MMAQILSVQEITEISRRVQIEDKADSWKEKSRRLKVAEEEEKIARQELIEACGQSYEGCGVKVEEVTRKGSIEYKAIPELANVNTEAYRKEPTTYWLVKPSIKE